MTNQELVQKYKEIYQRKTGLDLSDQEAFDQAMNLVTLVNSVYKPIPK